MGVAILKQGLTKGPLSHDPEWFNKDDNYATAVQQALVVGHVEPYSRALRLRQRKRHLWGNGGTLW